MEIEQVCVRCAKPFASTVRAIAECLSMNVPAVCPSCIGNETPPHASSEERFEKFNEERP